VFTLLVVSHPGYAQQAAYSGAPPVRTGAAIFVLDTQGIEHRGRFVRLEIRNWPCSWGMTSSDSGAI